jgi:phage baseplate assembly protein gpV
MKKQLAYATLAMLAALPAATAQNRQTDRDAFTWSGRIPDGRWIKVRNLNGAITVEPGSGDRVEVTATKQWRKGDPDVVHFEVQKFGSNGESVVICALWGTRSSCDENNYESRGDRSTRNNDVSVEFRVRVPRGVRVGVYTINGGVNVDGATAEVEANTVNGSVDATTTGGPINASTVNGAVRVRMGRFTSDEDMSFSTVNGSVTAEFTGDIDADVDLGTVNGRFFTDYPVTVSGRLDPRHLKARIGRGGPRIKLSTVNGNVELRRR